MTENDFNNEVDRLLMLLSSLPVHTPEEIRVAAEQLAGMNATLGIGRIELDPAGAEVDQIRRIAGEILDMSFDELEKTRNIERPYKEGDKAEWVRIARLSRLKILLDQYSLLCRLRSDEPEAWDEMNELFYDD